MAFWKLLLTAYLLVNPVFGIDITEDKVDRGAIDLSAGDITIHSGASWSIINNALTSILGSVEVQEEAGLYITLTSPLLALEVTLTSLIDSITNDGVIAFNSVASLTSATYNLVGASFTNNGEMYLGASGLLPSLMSITAADWTNEGLLVFYQNQRTSGVVTLGAVLPIKNNGQICLFHETYQQSTPITGSGCITTQVDSLIYFPNSLLSVDSAQSIYLADRKSSIIVQALSAPQTFNVYGFGNGNKIGLSVPLAGALVTSPYSYDSKTGILTLRAAVLSQKFNIGTGYDSRNFEIVTDTAGGLLSTLKGSVRYNGPVPERELPEACQIPCKGLPEAPGTEPSEYTTTVTEIGNGRFATRTGVVQISTDENGEWHTTTSIFPTEAKPTVFTSTWEVTDKYGVIATESGVVSSFGEILTTLTTFPQPAKPTVFTSTWEVTDKDGVVATESGVVSSFGEILTTLTTFPQPAKPTVFTSTWEVTDKDGSLVTESGVVSMSGSSAIVVTIFPRYYDYEFTVTWEVMNSDGSVSTKSGIVSKSGSSMSTYTTFPHTSESEDYSAWSTSFDNVFTTTTAAVTESDFITSTGLQSESHVVTQYTTTWTTTGIEGVIATESGVVTKSGASVLTIITFPRYYDYEFTSTWEVTNDDGLVTTESGVVRVSGTSTSTVTTFPYNDVSELYSTSGTVDSNMLTTTESVYESKTFVDESGFTSSWTNEESGSSEDSTKSNSLVVDSGYTSSHISDNFIMTDNGVIDQSGSSLRTLSTAPSEKSVLFESNYALESNSESNSLAIETDFPSTLESTNSYTSGISAVLEESSSHVSTIIVLSTSQLNPISYSSTNSQYENATVSKSSNNIGIKETSFEASTVTEIYTNSGDNGSTGNGINLTEVEQSIDDKTVTEKGQAIGSTVEITKPTVSAITNSQTAGTQSIDDYTTDAQVTGGKQTGDQSSDQKPIGTHSSEAKPLMTEPNTAETKSISIQTKPTGFEASNEQEKGNDSSENGDKEKVTGDKEITVDTKSVAIQSIVTQHTGVQGSGVEQGHTTPTANESTRVQEQKTGETQGISTFATTTVVSSSTSGISSTGVSVIGIAENSTNKIQISFVSFIFSLIVLAV